MASLPLAKRAGQGSLSMRAADIDNHSGLINAGGINFAIPRSP